MELNREQIVKALECCLTTSEGDCSECGYRGKTRSCFLTCTNYLISDALALIKELTEENKNLEQAYECADSARRELSSKCDELTEENEKIGIENFDLVCELSRIKEDTVRKMQEMLQLFFGTYVIGYKIPLTEALKAVNQIAKEMLEGDICGD